ncbi:Signal transduction histidine kinase [Paramicrobacterium humi]|uniref:histidine kinase n=2 Tax=Paramicrobacterium humi TaxID=640635 RepID=A0A1H4PGF4_9MICO|nr:Signal transduction histidine kinase [Microbacterium humi]
MPPAVRLWLPVILSFVVQLFGTVGILAWTRPGSAATWAVALLVAVAGPLALIAARRLPGPVATVTVAAAVVDLLLPPAFQPLPLALLFGVVLGIVRGARVWVYASLALGWSVALLLGGLSGVLWHPGRIVGTTLGLIVLCGIAEGARVRRQRAKERRRRFREQRASAEQEERVRIARELHDVIAHSLSQISVQAGVGLHLMDAQPEQARTALENIKATSKAALDDVRGVLGVLRGDDAPLAPSPGLAQLPQLAASVTAITVQLDAIDVGRVPDTVQQAAYRIVQESLTNVVRHARATAAHITVRREAGMLVVSVADDGRGGPIEPGNGVLGMTERAEQLGGRLEISATASGTTVTATLPVGEETR